MKLADKSHPITVTSKNIGESLILNILDHEFYWEEKCKDHKNLKKHGHGGNKQAYVETHIKKLLESQKDEASMHELKKELEAARYEIFHLNISQLLSHLDMSIVFKFLPNLCHLTLTYGAKHVGMEYERPLFGMKMSDAKIFAECLRST